MIFMKLALLFSMLGTFPPLNTPWVIRIENEGNQLNGLGEVPVLNVAEVQFFHRGTKVEHSLFNFSASSYLLPSNFNDGRSGPPNAANDGDKRTIFHSAYLGAVGYKGQCCPDKKPTLTITADDATLFDRFEIINRPFLPSEDNNFYYRFNGSVITISSSSNATNIIFHTVVTTADPSYVYFVRISEAVQHLISI